MVSCEIKREKGRENRMKRLKNPFIALIVFCLVFSSFGRIVSAEEVNDEGIDISFNDETIEERLEDLEEHLDLEGIVNVDVKALFPYETESKRAFKEFGLQKPDSSTSSSNVTINGNGFVDLPGLPVEKPITDDEPEMGFTIKDLERDRNYVKNIKENFGPINKEIIDKNDIVFEIQGQDDLGESFISSLGISLSDNVITISSEVDGRTEEYKLILNELNEETLDGIFINPSTGEQEEIHLSTEDIETSNPLIYVLYPLVKDLLPVIVAISVLVYLAVTGQLNIVGHAIYVSAVYVIENIQKKNQRFNYFKAKRTDNKYGLFVGPGITENTAISELKSFRDTIALFDYLALRVAKKADRVGAADRDEPHQPYRASGVPLPCYRWYHYHPRTLTNSKSERPHSFWLQAKKFTKYKD